ncbi:MAG: DUF4097 family beta strand repeat-containing protein [Bdellovibrionota bacterium]
MIHFRISKKFKGISRLAGLLVVGFAFCNGARAGDYAEDIERGPFFIRSREHLQITNNRGSITVQGWAFDKIRVKARRRVVAKDLDDAKLLFAAADIRFRTLGDGSVELSAEYGKKLDIEQRLRERENPKTTMDIVVFAPANLALRVWALDGKVFIKNRVAPVEVRTSTGPILIENVRGETISALCSSCTISVHAIQGNLRCMGGSGDIDVIDVKGNNIYAESTTGSIRLARVQGEQLIVSKSGAISGRAQSGYVQFHTQQAPVEILDASGFLTGKTDSGNIVAKMRSWRFEDKGLIESAKGSITLTLPSNFSGDLDVKSILGRASVGYSLQNPGERISMGPEPANHLAGRIGDGGEILKVFSESGDIQILRGD